MSDKVKAALLAAFGPGRFQAYGSLQSRVLREEETVEAYLSDIKRLILLTGVVAIPKQWVECAFTQGLPSNFREQLAAQADVEKMSAHKMMLREKGMRVTERQVWVSWYVLLVQEGM